MTLSGVKIRKNVICYGSKPQADQGLSISTSISIFFPTVPFLFRHALERLMGNRFYPEKWWCNETYWYCTSWAQHDRSETIDGSETVDVPISWTECVPRYNYRGSLQPWKYPGVRRALRSFSFGYFQLFFLCIVTLSANNLGLILRYLSQFPIALDFLVRIVKK